MQRNEWGLVNGESYSVTISSFILFVLYYIYREDNRRMNEAPKANLVRRWWHIVTWRLKAGRVERVGATTASSGMVNRFPRKTDTDATIENAVFSIRSAPVVSCQWAVTVCGFPLGISIVSSRYVATTSDNRIANRKACVCCSCSDEL
jgi:hypothetical protein